ncbi:MAG: hypothetical protein F4X82_02210 [Candidatus Spechtbacteria bacterium SB0662_bin_43]|uniref:Uncharacterized protein n=1 Tax=Candidatus Spechtbacteria bacterium SB0662_bin_43 TaxID=2604897 RepID=A0A845D9B8_9BACT|nr:hypothetical protein [Candidatus Spechtbacteria bacterium SB0662_bin_43]
MTTEQHFNDAYKRLKEEYERLSRYEYLTMPDPTTLPQYKRDTIYSFRHEIGDISKRMDEISDKMSDIVGM